MIAVTCVDMIPESTSEDTLISIPYRNSKFMLKEIDESEDETHEFYLAMVECFQYLSDDQLTLVALNSKSSTLIEQVKFEKERRERGA